MSKEIEEKEKNEKDIEYIKKQIKIIFKVITYVPFIIILFLVVDILIRTIEG